MNPERIARFYQRFAQLLPSLPKYLGLRWHPFWQAVFGYWQVLEQSTDPTQRRQAYMALRTLLHDEYPELLELLSAQVSTLAASVMITGNVTESWTGANIFLNRSMAPAAPKPAPLVTRYTDITCPQRVWIGERRLPVVVGLTLRPARDSDAPPAAMQLTTDLPVEVRITAPNFAVLGPQARPLVVLPDQDSEPVVFYLQPQASGFTHISLDFVQGGRPLPTVLWAVEITREQVSPTTIRLSQLLEIEPAAPRPDLLLYVADDMHDGRPHLRMTLYEDGAEQGLGFAPLPLPGSLAGFMQRLYDSLAEWTDAAAGGPLFAGSNGIATLPKAVRQAGEQLWWELFPDDFKRHYAEKRQAWQGKTLLLVSDEPHIPWELVWPYAAGEWQDDQPWCLSLNLMRWLRRGEHVSGCRSPSLALTLNALACVAPISANLPSAQREQAFLHQWMMDHGVRDASPHQCSLGDVRGLAEAGGYDWLHVAAHGLPADPAAGVEQAGAILLDAGDPLTSDCFLGNGPQTHIAARRPGFFLNACHSGRQGQGLTSLSGWAPRLLAFGAGAVVAPLWTVSDRSALAFATSFYNHLPTDTVGDALRAARRQGIASGDPTWLAYSVFAHPQARVQVGDHHV